MTLCAFGANTGQKKAKYGGHFEIQNDRRRHTRKKMEATQVLFLRVFGR